ncbi:MAG: hypothetical protein JRJ15_00400 [Deltaproteobacteria bacterium]|nr:hypothetical protein [Deltaproteobacteria bacterium]
MKMAYVLPKAREAAACTEVEAFQRAANDAKITLPDDPETMDALKH